MLPPGHMAMAAAAVEGVARVAVRIGDEAMSGTGANDRKRVYEVVGLVLYNLKERLRMVDGRGHDPRVTVCVCEPSGPENCSGVIELTVGWRPKAGGSVETRTSVTAAAFADLRNPHEWVNTIAGNVSLTLIQLLGEPAAKWRCYQPPGDLRELEYSVRDFGHLVVRRKGKDGGPIAWDELQAVKNAVFGPEAWCVEVFPAMSVMVANAPHRHLWVWTGDFDPRRENL